MRIISGVYRGKKLFSPDSDNVRPTSDRAREAIFNILDSKISGTWADLSLLDVFSGSGAFALEAISRGIKKVGMIDIDTRPLLKNTALFSKEQNRIKVIKADAKSLPPALEKYDIMFMDAPYNKGLSLLALQQLSAKKWLSPNALCIVEVEKNETLDAPEEFELIDERNYGLAKVFFFTYKA